MPCKHGYLDCKKEDSEACNICFSKIYGEYAKADIKKHKELARRQSKPDKRAGSEFEYRSYRIDKEMFSDDVVTRMTANSGATMLEKGDQQILGLLKVMIEDKTKTTIKAPGKKTFTIHKEWLDKLLHDANAADMEFHYLKFNFYQYDNDIYVIAELDQINSMVTTMYRDRKRSKKLERQLEAERKRYELLEQEKSELYVRIGEYEKNKELMDFMNKEKE